MQSQILICQSCAVIQSPKAMLTLINAYFSRKYDSFFKLLITLKHFQGKMVDTSKNYSTLEGFSNLFLWLTKRELVNFQENYWKNKNHQRYHYLFTRNDFRVFVINFLLVFSLGNWFKVSSNKTKGYLGKTELLPNIFPCFAFRVTGTLHVFRSHDHHQV